MSLFKILEGDSSRISTDITPFHQGWCYYTSDDGGFYIDAIKDGKPARTRINECVGVRQYTKIFTASNWSGGKITIPASEHKLSLDGGNILSQVFLLKDGEYSDQSLAALDTKVSVSGDKSVVLSYDGAAFSGKVVLIG